MSLDASPLVSIRNLSFKRGDRAIFENISLDVARGKVTAIMGPSGCGKTTTLRFIGGQLHPDEGQVLVDGQNVPDMSRKELFMARAKMGMLFQSGALFSDLSVYENVAFPLRAHTQLPEKLIREIVLMKLEAVGLRGAIDLMPNELSGGMQRRAALARAIALDPDLIMYDEPFAGQDPMVKGVLVTLIRTLREALGLTTIIVSHDVPETLHIADYIYIIANKGIIGQGTPKELKQSDSPFVQQFLNGSPDGPVRFHYPASSYLQELGVSN
ncbi:MAG TPA: ATP-binding cassette domain-containing protein [Agitococcus sp.]|nr:ATP-binding cassette domain-containing protein [Agitococcus sp.]HNE91980.1 ATP-binding cassette domain-containing protein [Agitococcus sp.]HNL79030.1 ATP-binding cassette domain-containing protein [Agitococcus sp.]